MHTLRLLLFLLSFVSLNSMASLKEYQWKNRLLLLNTYSQSDWREQEKAFLAAPKENADRQLLLLKAKSSEDPLFHKYKMKKGKFSMYLIGKDGGLKKVYDRRVSMKKIYQFIDSMPMRKLEMQDEQNSKK